MVAAKMIKSDFKIAQNQELTLCGWQLYSCATSFVTFLNRFINCGMHPNLNLVKYIFFGPK